MPHDVPIRDSTTLKAKLVLGSGVLLYFAFLMTILLSSNKALSHLQEDVTQLTMDNAITMQLLQRALNITDLPG
jgi:hypothetical protein